MSVRSQWVGIAASVGLSLSLAGCGDEGLQESGLLTTQQPKTGWNGTGWNGTGWNGTGWNGTGWNGTGWNGTGWNGTGWNGIGWNGTGWNGTSWGGIGSAQDCIAGSSDTCTTLHDWVNHSDGNGNGVQGFPGDPQDVADRVTALSYWVNCACDPSVVIPFSDTHGVLSTTFYGNLGLAPTWCGSDPSAEVPRSEIEIVSACLIARVNTKGKHYPLSLRSTEAGTALSDNERFLQRRPLAMYWGNLWKLPHADFDGTSPISSDPMSTGGTWWNLERFSFALSLTKADAVSTLLSDQHIYGRDCEISDCGEHLEYLGTYWSRKMLGNKKAWDPQDPATDYSVGVEPALGGPKVDGGVTVTPDVNATGGTITNLVHYRGRTWRALEVYGPNSISIEDPSPTPYPGGLSYWTQIEEGSIPAAQSVSCSGNYYECQGSPNQQGRKLLGLSSSQVISINFSGNVPIPLTTQGSPSEAVSVAIRYSRPMLLGDGQCDPDDGCAGTKASQCASGSVGPSGCIGGVASPGRLRMWVNNTQPQSPGWTLVHGAGAPFKKSLFPPTGSETKYSTAYIYPIYLQDSSSSIPGAKDQTPNAVAYDTLRTKLTGETEDPADAPVLDTAYYFPGPPPADANCKGSQECWVYVGVNHWLSLVQGLDFTYTSPQLPPGAYTFEITDVVNDADLYVKVNGRVSTESYDCRPFLKRAGASESCTVRVPGNGGTVSIMVRSASREGARVHLIGSNL